MVMPEEEVSGSNLISRKLETLLVICDFVSFTEPEVPQKPEFPFEAVILIKLPEFEEKCPIEYIKVFRFKSQ